MSYRYEKLTPQNVADLQTIYSDAFKKDVSVDFLHQKQNTDFTPIAYVGYIAYSEQNEPAGFYGVFPCWVSYNGRKYLAVQSGDTMTHSQHTGKGLFTALAKETYKYCRKNGVHLVFGFPNENSYPGFTRKLDWIHFDDILAYEMRVKCLPWIRLKNIFRLPQSLHDGWCNFVLRFVKKGKPFASSCEAPDVPVVHRDAPFFNYKTYDKNFLMEVAGVNVWLKFDEMFLLIGDIEKCSEQKFVEVIAALKRWAFLMGLPHLRFHGSAHTWGVDLFAKYGNRLEAKYPAGGVNFSGEVPLEKMKFSMADNDTF